MQNSIRSQRRRKTYFKKFEKTSFAVHLSFLHAKQFLMKLFFENLQTDANLLFGLMPANCTPTRCVNACRPVFIRREISIRKPVEPYLDKTRPAAMKIWSCLIFYEKDQNVKLNASLQQADWRKLTASVLMGFFSQCKTVFEAKGCSYHFCPRQELRPSLTEEDIKRGRRRKELDELRRGYI